MSREPNCTDCAWIWPTKLVATATSLEIVLRCFVNVFCRKVCLKMFIRSFVNPPPDSTSHRRSPSVQTTLARCLTSGRHYSPTSSGGSSALKGRSHIRCALLRYAGKNAFTYGPSPCIICTQTTARLWCIRDSRQHPLHEGLIWFRRPPLCGTQRNQYDAAAALARSRGS